MRINRLSLKRIEKGNLRGWMSEEILPRLPFLFFEDPVSFIQAIKGEIVKESRWRWAATFSLPGGQNVFLKRDRTKGWIEYLKFWILPSKGRKEWLIADQLQKRDLNVPKPLGWMERAPWGLVRESYYLSEAIGSGASLLEHSGQFVGRVPMDGLAKTIRRFHDSGLLHKDLHAGNLLWMKDSFYLTDLHRAKVLRSLSMDQRLWNLSQLFHSFRSQWGRGDQMEFIEGYFEGDPLDVKKREEYFQKILSMMGRLQRRQWKSRTKRCLKESTEFSIKKEKGMTLYHRRDFPLDRIKKVIEGHLHFVQERPFALKKHSPEINVSLLKDGEDKICVKQFQYPRLWDRWKERCRYSKGLKSWISGNGLKVRGIPSLEAFAFIEKRNGLGLKESLFLMEASETDQELDQYLFEGFGDFKKKRLFIQTFSRWLFALHQRDVYHRDMKACNILVSEKGEGWDFYFLDLEDVRLDEKVDEKKLFKNLLQLNTSIPKTITKADRLRFFREYIHFRPIVRRDKIFLNRLLQKSIERGVVYVSPQGVVEEKWC